MVRILIGGCAKIPDGSIARIREKKEISTKSGSGEKQAKHIFLIIDTEDLKPITCP